MAESTEQAGPGPQLDADVLIDEILAKKGPARYKDGLSEDNWEEVCFILVLQTTTSMTSI